MKGKFITVEGIEGVGKSSNIQFIRQELEKAGHHVLVTREPGGTSIAEDLRKILLNTYDEKTLPETELLILYAGRLQHVQHVIAPALEQGKWVVCDRFNDATYAYQGAGRGIPAEKIDTLNEWVLGSFVPDCTLILDASVEVGMSRIKPHRQLDRFENEKISFFEKIRNAYLARAKKDPKRYIVVDAEQTLVDVQNDLAKIIQSLSSK